MAVRKSKSESGLFLSSFSIENLGPIDRIDVGKLEKVNLLIGENSCGKTFIMKILYVICKEVEMHRRGKDISDLSASIREKLYWTFQPQAFDDLIFNGSPQGMTVSVVLAGNKYTLRLERGQEPQITESNDISERAKMEVNSLFLPAKEVLSSHQIIISAREDKSFGFDDTYSDLAKVLQTRPKKGKNYAKFAHARELIGAICHAKPIYDERDGSWKVERDGHLYGVGVTSEGIKKLSILDILLGNRYLTPGSIVFIDEPESALHPAAIGAFMNAIVALAECGIQFFLASHSYFVIKKLENIAASSKMSIPVFSYENGGWKINDLQDGLPDNPIVEESVRLYMEHINL